MIKKVCLVLCCVVQVALAGQKELHGQNATVTTAPSPAEIPTSNYVPSLQGWGNPDFTPTTNDLPYTGEEEFNCWQECGVPAFVVLGGLFLSQCCGLDIFPHDKTN